MPIITTHYSETSRAHGGQWQVIFKININGEIKDYCREQPPRIIPEDLIQPVRHMELSEVTEWAELSCIQYNLHGAEIQWF